MPTSADIARLNNVPVPGTVAGEANLYVEELLEMLAIQTSVEANATTENVSTGT